MRAVMVRDFDAPETIAVEELPSPVPGPGEVRIDVHAIGVNFPDLLVVRGQYQVRPPLPFSPGKEVAGVIAGVGPGVSRWHVGDRVLALVEYGGYAEEVVTREELCHAMPSSMSFATAAATGNVYQTAHFALVDRSCCRRGETVLVTGASGGVGHAAVQLAKASGATVLAGVRRPEQAELARADGAEHVIDLSVANLRDAVRDQVRNVTGDRGVDVVLENVGGDVFDGCLRALAWRGRLVVIGFAGGRIPQVKANYLLVKNITVSGLQWSDYRDRDPALVARVQAEIFALFETGEIRPRVVGEYALEDFAEAHARLRRGHVNGKLILKTRRRA